MKILAFVDMHGSKNALDMIKSKAKKVDLIICAGDVSVFERNLQRHLTNLSTIDKPILMIPGNHETPDLLKRMCDKFDNIFYIHKGTFEFGGVSFIGYGEGGFDMRDEVFVRFTKKIKPSLREKKVLITHAPPFGTIIDWLGNSHVGNKDYSDFLKHNKINLMVCGHLHETSGKEDRINKTKIINPGPYGRIIEI